MFLLDNAIRDYAWGTFGDLASFAGREPSGGPEAELWIGAHPGAPSRLPDGRPLDQVIAAEPEAMLGDRVRDMFGDRLPFLLKVLAVEEPLSLQVHPSSEPARIGHAREEQKGIPVDAPERSYRDRSHKPELFYALSRFEGMAGFRAIDESVELLRLLDLPWADDLAKRLESGPAYQALRTVVMETLALSGPELSRLVRRVGRAARQAEARGRREEVRYRSADGDHAAINREAIRVFGMLARVSEKYPEDPGVLVTPLLNHVVLAPGEAMFVAPGVVHGYCSGVGLEIMASSDNVLRAGLTPKHVDVEEVLRITNFTPMPPPRWDPVERTQDSVRYDPPAAEFGLTVGRPPFSHLPDSGPRVLLALQGEVEVSSSGRTLRVARGRAVFVPHEDGALTVTGDGTVALGSVPA